MAESRNPDKSQTAEQKSQNVAAYEIERTGGAQTNRGTAWNRPTQGSREMSGYKSFDEADEGPVYGDQKDSLLARSPRVDEDKEPRKEKSSSSDVTYDEVHPTGESHGPVSKGGQWGSAQNFTGKPKPHSKKDRTH